MESMLRMRIVALLLAILLIGLAGVLAVVRIDEKVSSPGVIEPIEFEEVRAREPHLIEGIAVDEGDEVTEGQVLARLDTRDIDEALAQQEQKIELLRSQRLVAVAALEKAAAIPFEKRLELARLNVERAKEQHKNASDLVERTLELRQKGFASKRELELARSAEKMAGLELQGSEQQLEMAEQDPERKDVQKAQSQVAHVDAQLAAASEEKDRLLSQLEERLVVAPRNGRIVGIYLEEGEKPDPGDVLFEIDGGGGWIAKLSIPEAFIGKLEVGQRARISCPAYPYRLYGYATGKLAFIGESAIRESTPAHFFGIVEVAESPFPLKNGASVRVEIITDRVSPFQIMFGKKTPK
jgi:multidrug resistance efflux pump